MTIDYNQIIVKNNEAEQRYEAQAGEYLAELVYEREGDTIIFLHTEVPSALSGHGIANKLAHTALEDARAKHLTVVPLCPFVASYIRRHQEYLSLLTPAEKARLLGA